MRSFANLISAVIVAFWISAIALISIQNIASISLSFLTFQTVALPFGIVLAFSVGVGLILGAIFPLLFASKQKRRLRYEPEIDPLEDWEEFEE